MPDLVVLLLCQIMVCRNLFIAVMVLDCSANTSRRLHTRARTHPAVSYGCKQRVETRMQGGHQGASVCNSKHVKSGLPEPESQSDLAKGARHKGGVRVHSGRAPR